jgi:hypothetical protein
VATPIVALKERHRGHKAMLPVGRISCGQASELIRLRSLEYRAALVVQFTETTKVVLPSITIALAWVIFTPRSIQTGTGARAKVSMPLSLANTIAMGVSAENMVLVADQMQLSQPIKGSHPGTSTRRCCDGPTTAWSLPKQDKTDASRFVPVRIRGSL